MPDTSVTPLSNCQAFSASYTGSSSGNRYLSGGRGGGY